MGITPEDAVNHIYNSLDNGNETTWFDAQEDTTWLISKNGSDSLTITLLHDDETEEKHTFKLVKTNA